MKWFLSDNGAVAKLVRTIVQGVIGVLIAYLGDIVGLWVADPTISAIICALVMAILSPVMATLGGKIDAGTNEAQDA